MSLIEIRPSKLYNGTMSIKWNGFRKIAIGGLKDEKDIIKAFKIIIKRILFNI